MLNTWVFYRVGKIFSGVSYLMLLSFWWQSQQVCQWVASPFGVEGGWARDWELVEAAPSGSAQHFADLPVQQDSRPPSSWWRAQHRTAVRFSLLSQRLACSLSKSMIVPSRSLPHLAFWTAVSNYGQETLQELHRRVIILSPRWQFVTLPVVWSAASHFTYSWRALDTF